MASEYKLKRSGERTQLCLFGLVSVRSLPTLTFVLKNKSWVKDW